MKIMRYLEGMIFGSFILMGVFDVMSLKTCGIICLLILFITVISERQYYNKHKKPWIDIFSMFYFLKTVKIERNKLYLTGDNKKIFDANANVMRKYGKRILEEGEKVVDNPQIAVEHRNEVKEIMEDVRQMLETEELL